MYCLYNGEYGEHDMSFVPALDDILKKQEKQYKTYEGVIVGDFTILKVEYDWGRRTQRATIKCNLCGEVSHLYGISDWRRGKGKSQRCKCRKKAKEKPPKQPKKPKGELLIGKEIGGWKAIKYAYGRLYVECAECGKQKQVSCKQFEESRIYPCNHSIPNDYSGEKWLNKRNGHLTTISKDGKFFNCKCDCGNIVKVRATDLFTNKTAISCSDKNCPHYSEKVVESRKRQRQGFDYEHKMQDLFEKKGYKIERTRDIGDFGVDFIIHLSKTDKVAVQVKKQKQPANLNVIQAVYSGGRFYDCNKFAVICTSGFTSNALKMAGRLGVYCSDVKFNVDELYKAREKAIELIEVLPPINSGRKFEATKWTINGASKTVKEWCEEYRVNESTVYSKLKKGYDIESALKGNNRKTYTIRGKTGTIKELSDYFGVIPQTVAYRMKYRNMTLEEALFCEEAS